MKNKDDLIYDLIFSENAKYKIDISEYVSDIYKYEEFVSDIKSVLKKSKIGVLKSSVILNSKTAIWDLSLRK